MTTRSSSALWTAVFLTSALFAIGQALHVNKGAYDPIALRWLTCALVACFVATLHVPLRGFETKAESAVVLIAGLAFAYQLTQLFLNMPGAITPPAPAVLPHYLRGITLAAVLGGAGMAPRPWLGKLQPLLLVAAFLYVGTWVIRNQPAPAIDVFVFQRLGVDAFLTGGNPWALRFPDIYGGHSPFYGEGVSINGQLQFGFPYPPASLMLSALGQKLAGDPRYAQLGAIGLSGLLIAYARPGRVGNALAAMFLFTPPVFLVVEQAWTEPFVILGLAATITAALRWPRAVPYVLGAFLAVKQYLVLALPLVWLLLPQRGGWRERAEWALKPIAIAALLTLPFGLWNPREFFRSLAEFQLHQPFRFDALSYLAWWAQRGHPPPASAWGFLAASLGIALSLWRAPRSPFGFAASVSFTFLLFFAFNKQAFCNYYYFVAGALAVAVCSATRAEEQTVMRKVEQDEAAHLDFVGDLASQPPGAMQ